MMTKKGGRPPKRLSDNPSRNTKEKLMEELLHYIVEFAEDQSVLLEEVIDFFKLTCNKEEERM